MKIVELCTSSGWGGLELYAVNISKWLAQQGHHCLLVMKQGSLIADRVNESKLETELLSPKLKFFPLLAARRLAKLLDRHECDILHVHWNKDLILAVLAKCMSRRKPKLVFIRHMALTRHKRDFYHRFIYRNIDAYLVITKRLQAEAEKFLPVDKNRIHLLYHGVGQYEQADATVCKEFLDNKGIAKDSFRILLPGRIEHGKGQHVMMEAIHLLHQQGLNVQVALLGHIMDKEYYKGLQQQIDKWGIGSQVHYLGFVENPVYIYNCFDALALTTYAETFGLVLIEGMKSHIAVIGTNAGGVPEIIQHGRTGMLFESGDAQQLANCIRQLAQDEKLRNKIAEAGYLFASETFSEKQHYDKLIEIFASV